MQKLLFLFLFSGLNQFGIAQKYLPKSNGEVVEHNYYILSYLEDFEQAEWVYYVLTPEMLRGNASRTNNFRADPRISTGSAHPTDYQNSGFDRGHLVPAADMRVNNLAMRESFYMSNMSPQSIAFNRGVWKKLESLIRAWASEEKIHIATGGILVSGLREIGHNGVEVPDYFYKVIYALQNNKMTAFLLPNEKGEKTLREYVVSVDQVEKLTNIDFFPQLVDEVEEELESKINLSDWNFSISNAYKPPADSEINPPARCKGITKSTGLRCKRNTSQGSDFCWQHR